MAEAPKTIAELVARCEAQLATTRADIAKLEGSKLDATAKNFLQMLRKQERELSSFLKKQRPVER